MSGVDPPAPAAQVEAHERPVGRFHLAWPAWLPKTVIVTAGLTLVTAWLFPALTHQWQDRQKARELSAALVAEIGKETSQALVTSAFFSGGRTPFVVGRHFNQQLFNHLDLGWRNTGAQIESQLQAYYSQTVLDRWRAYTRLVQKTYFLATPDLYQRTGTIELLRRHSALDPLPDEPALSIDEPGLGRAATGEVDPHRRRPARSSRRLQHASERHHR